MVHYTTGMMGAFNYLTQGLNVQDANAFRAHKPSRYEVMFFFLRAVIAPRFRFNLDKLHLRFVGIQYNVAKTILIELVAS